MLQWTTKENRLRIFPLVLCVCFLSACKKDASTGSSEEQAYLADYEAPKYKWGFMDTSGTLVIKALYDDVGSFQDGIAAFNIGGKWGFIAPSGNVVIEPVYKAAWAFHEGFARVEPFDAPSQFIRKNGTRLSARDETPWSAADDFSEGLAKVKVGQNYGYVDTTGKMKIGAVYARAWNFDSGIAKVEFEEKLGVINSSGEIILPFAYDQVRVCTEARFLIGFKENRSSLFDFTGHLILDNVDGKIMDTDGQNMAVLFHDQYFLVPVGDVKPKDHTPYENVVYLGSHRWAVKKADGYRVVDNTGKILHAPGYKQINQFKNDYAVVCRNEYWGYLDLEGHEKIGHPFGLAWDFKDGFARAAFKEGIAFINRRLELAFYPPSATVDMRDFSAGFAPVQIAN